MSVREKRSCGNQHHGFNTNENTGKDRDDATQSKAKYEQNRSISNHHSLKAQTPSLPVHTPTQKIKSTITPNPCAMHSRIELHAHTACIKLTHNQSAHGALARSAPCAIIDCWSPPYAMLDTAHIHATQDRRDSQLSKAGELVEDPRRQARQPETKPPAGAQAYRQRRKAPPRPRPRAPYDDGIATRLTPHHPNVSGHAHLEYISQPHSTWQPEDF